MGSPWSSASAGCNRVHSAPLPDFVFASRSFADLFATCPALISEFHSARSPRLRFGSRLRSINYFASLVHSAELMNVEPKAVLGFLSFSIVFIEIPFKALANRQYIFIEKIASDLHVKSRFTFVSSVDAVRASRQPNMEGNFLIALRAALDFARKKLGRGVRWASGLSRSGHRPLTIYENRRKFSRALLRAAKGTDCRSLWGELLNPRRGRGEGRRRAYIEEEGVLNEKLWTVVYGLQRRLVLCYQLSKKSSDLGWLKDGSLLDFFFPSPHSSLSFWWCWLLPRCSPFRSTKLKLTKKYFDDLAKNESRSSKWNAIGGGSFVSNVNWLSELSESSSYLFRKFQFLAKVSFKEYFLVTQLTIEPQHHETVSQLSVFEEIPNTLWIKTRFLLHQSFFSRETLAICSLTHVEGKVLMIQQHFIGKTKTKTPGDWKRERILINHSPTHGLRLWAHRRNNEFPTEISAIMIECWGLEQDLEVSMARAAICETIVSGSSFNFRKPRKYVDWRHLTPSRWVTQC